MAEQEQTAGSQVRLVMRQPAREHQQEALGTQPAGQMQRDPLTLAPCREGGAGCADEQASTLNRVTDGQPARAPGSLLRLQREYGNRFVRRVVNLSRKGQGEGDVAPEVEQAIQTARGGGQSLDSTVRAQMEPAMGADFSGVRVHTGGQADTLNRNLNARAFTTGQDIFFKQGEYSPGSSGGRELLAHELTHVVQQNGDQVQTKLTVGAPGDRYEQEADQVASSVMRQEQQPDQQRTMQRQPVPEEEEKKEPMQAKRDDGHVHRQAEEENKKEEEPVQMKLQNHSVQRQAPATAPKPSVTPAADATLPSADELTTRIARCVGIWETNRGKDNPAPKESGLDTVAGVHASMATIEQATMPYAITALKGHKELRDKATPPLTMKELNDAEARCTAVVTLLTSVTSASTRGETPDDFIKNNAAAILASGLSNDDVRTMFSAVTLKSTLDTARTDAETEGKTAKEEAVKEKKTAKEQAAAEKAAKQKSVKTAIDAIPTADRLGLGEGSLKAYTNKPGNWGENRAGWQRKAVASMADNVGSRIEAVAVSDNGTALAVPVIKTRVNAELAKKPAPSLEEIVKTVAQQNNPGEKDYGVHVWETYDRLYD